MTSESIIIRQIIEAFINDRLQAKLLTLKEDEREKRQKLLQDYERESWLADAARRVSQLQLVTHNIKPTHPNARGSQFYYDLKKPLPAGIVGSAGETFPDDVVGNAAVLDVYKFLKLEYGNYTFLQLAQKDDTHFKIALSDDPTRANEWCDAFVNITNNASSPASHTLAKQLYFPLIDTASYHLLAPLYPTALAHRLYLRIQADRFGEVAKAARQARRTGNYSEDGFREYPGLAQRKYGGSKPQNISQLNSERGGVGYLLLSCPPQWYSQGFKPPLYIKTLFNNRLNRRRQINEHTKALREFFRKLSASDYKNVAIRNTRKAMVDRVIDEVLFVAMQIQSLTAGWSASSECQLNLSEALWLDPGRAKQDDEFAALRRANDWQEEVCNHFANWLNTVIRSDEAPMGDAEFYEWKRCMDKEIKSLEQEVPAHD